MLLARHFQILIATYPDEARKAVGVCKAEKDTCLLFVDGLRMDIAANWQRGSSPTASV